MRNVDRFLELELVHPSPDSEGEVRPSWLGRRRSTGPRAHEHPFMDALRREERAALQAEAAAAGTIVLAALAITVIVAFAPELYAMAGVHGWVRP